MSSFLMPLVLVGLLGVTGCASFEKRPAAALADLIEQRDQKDFFAPMDQKKIPDRV